MKIFKIFGTKNNKSNYLNSQEFYRRRPDLAPRNIYLATGRVIEMEEVQKYINKHFNYTFLEKCEKTIKKLWNKIYR